VEYVEALGKQVNKLERLLKRHRNWFLPSALFEDRFWQLWLHQDIAFEINPRARGYITQEPEQLTRFREWLNQIRARCDQIKKLGQHGG